MSDLYFQIICNLPNRIRSIMDDFQSFDEDLQEHYLEDIWYDSNKVKEFLLDPKVSHERKVVLVLISNEINSIDGFVQWFGEKFGDGSDDSA